MENLSLFNQNDDSEIMMEGLFESGNLDVIKMDFIEAETMSWRDLFSGFDPRYRTGWYRLIYDFTL